MTNPRMVPRPGSVVLAGIGRSDPWRLLLHDPALVVAVEPCASHLHRAELYLAALRCLGRRDFGRFDRPRHRAKLYGRVRWLLTPSAAAWWDGRIETPEGAASGPPASEEAFEAMKVRAPRLQLVRDSLDRYLSTLPPGFADVVDRSHACGLPHPVAESWDPVPLGALALP